MNRNSVPQRQRLRIALPCVLALTAIAGSAGRAAAQSPSANADSPPVRLLQESSDNSSAAVCARAVYSLRTHRRTAAAIQQLEALTCRDPTNSKAFLLLGAANAVRAVYIAEAARQAAQTNGGAAATDGSSGLVTYDEDAPLTLTVDEAYLRVDVLAKSCLASLDKGVLLTPEKSVDRAEAEYVRAWVTLLLTRCRSGVAKPAVEKTKQIQDAFRRCVVQSPGEIRFRHSLAIALQLNAIFFEYADQPHDEGQCIDELQKAIRLEPRRFDLLYQLSVFSEKSQPDLSLASLRTAARLDGSNAVIWYQLAHRLFLLANGPDRGPDPAGPALAAITAGIVAPAVTLLATEQEARVRQALNAVDSGNGAGDYMAVEIKLPLPHFLVPGFRLTGILGARYDAGVAMRLAMDMKACAERLTLQKQDERAAEVGKSLMLLGLRSAQNYQSSDIDDGGAMGRAALNLRLMMGETAYGVGLAIVQQAARNLGTSDLDSFIDDGKATLASLKKNEAALPGR